MRDGLVIFLGEVMSIVCWVEGSSVFLFVVDGELLVPGVSLFVSDSFTVDSLDVLCDSGVG